MFNYPFDYYEEPSPYEPSSSPPPMNCPECGSNNVDQDVYDYTCVYCGHMWSAL